MKTDVVIFIIGAGIATYLTRFPMMILSNKKSYPRVF